MRANSFFEDEWYLYDSEGVYLNEDACICSVLPDACILGFCREGETTKSHLNQNGIKLKH